MVTKVKDREVCKSAQVQKPNAGKPCLSKPRTRPSTSCSNLSTPRALKQSPQDARCRAPLAAKNEDGSVTNTITTTLPTQGGSCTKTTITSTALPDIPKVLPDLGIGEYKVKPVSQSLQEEAVDGNSTNDSLPGLGCTGKRTPTTRTRSSCSWKKVVQNVTNVYLVEKKKNLRHSEAQTSTEASTCATQTAAQFMEHGVVAETQTESLTPHTPKQTQTEVEQPVHTGTQMEQLETAEATTQIEPAMAGPDLYLAKLLEISAEKKFTLDLGSKKITVQLQGGRIVVRTGGGFLKLEEFLMKYGLLGSEFDCTEVDGCEVGTVVRRGSSVKLTSFSER